jgi:hypothetical protein
MYFSPASYYFIHPRSEFSPQRPVLKHPRFFSLMSETKFQNHIELQTKLQIRNHYQNKVIQILYIRCTDSKISVKIKRNDKKC